MPKVTVEYRMNDSMKKFELETQDKVAVQLTADRRGIIDVRDPGTAVTKRLVLIANAEMIDVQY